MEDITVAEINVNVDNFEEVVLKSELPVLVDFWAPWCAPCKMLGPSIAAVADSYEGKITVAKVNVDDNAPLAIEYGVEGIPAVKLFKNGEVVDQFVGLRPQKAIEQFVDANL